MGPKVIGHLETAQKRFHRQVWAIPSLLGLHTLIKLYRLIYSQFSDLIGVLMLVKLMQF